MQFIKHYKQHKEKYGAPENYEKTIRTENKRKWKEKILTEAQKDADSKLGSYYDVNPNFNFHHVTAYTDILELERITLTRYRTGSHNLKIEKGRHTYPITPRDQRQCKCNDGVQTLRHVIFDCNLLNEMRNNTTYSTTTDY